jgi:DNA-directed RNA polymerase I subunit RPA1
MSVPLDDSVTDKQALRLTRSFTKLTLNELIAAQRGITVLETLVHDSGYWQRAYYVSLKFHKAERIKTAFGISLEDIAQVVAGKFEQEVRHQMKLELRRSSQDYEGDIEVHGGSSSFVTKGKGKQNDEDNEDGANRSEKDNENDMLGDDDDDDDDDENSAGEEDGVMASRKQEDGYIDDEAMEGNDEDDSSADEGENEDDNMGSDERAGEPKDVQMTDFTNTGSEMTVDYKTNSIHLARLMVDPSSRPLLMVGLIEKAAAKTLVRSKRKIDAAFVNEEDGRGRCLQTAGINFAEIWKLERVDHNRLMSNDIWAVRCAYGVEAARNTIVDQIRSVFGVYGIEVDPRHLSLIADYMTFGGDYTPMNRTGMREASSPFLQMSFETTAQFLTYAALKGNSDALNSPSANIVVGRPIRHGTGAFSLLVS